MLRLFLFQLLILAFFNVSLAQVNDEIFHIIHIQGTILNKNSNDVLKRGMKLSAKDKVVFKSKDAKAVVLGTKRGRFIMSAKPTASGSELVAFVNDVVSPLKTNSQLSTRGTEDAEEVIDFQDFFGSDAFAIVGDNFFFKVNTSKYPLSDKKFFVFRYVFNGKAINKKIGFDGNVLSLKKDVLFKVNNEEVPVNDIEKVQIYYYDSESKSSKEMAAFKPVFINEFELKGELEELNTMMANEKMQEKDKLDEYFKFVSDVYGRTDKHALSDWLKANKF